MLCSYVYHGAHGTNLNDGVVFTPGNQGYWQTKGALLKWKWFEDNTVDFFVDGDALHKARQSGPGVNMTIAAHAISHTYAVGVAQMLVVASRLI